MLVAGVGRFAEHFRVAIPELADGHLLHRCDFFSDVQLHVCLLVVQGNRSRGPLTAVDHTEHGFAGKLKAIERGIARIPGVVATGQRLPLPEPQNSRRKDRCNVDKPLFVGPARDSAQLVMVFSPQENATARGDGWGRFRGRARPLLLTYRAEARIDGESLRLWRQPPIRPRDIAGAILCGIMKRIRTSRAFAEASEVGNNFAGWPRGNRIIRRQAQATR